MEGFNNNPFEDANPFADSSVNEARRKTDSNGAQLDNYNPFEHDQFTHQQPAVIQPSETRSTSYTPTPAAATATLSRQQEELERRAAELDRREQDLNLRATVVSGLIKNFPPLPSFCPCQPCFVQDFNIDIPQPFQLIVRIHFYMWISFSILMLINIGGSMAYFIASNSTNSGTTFGLSIFYFIILPVLSYVFWFRAIYNAFKNDSSINYFIYFLVFFVHNCINIFWCLGVPSSGTVGFINGLEASKSNTAVGVLMIVIGVLFGLIGAIGIILIMRVLHIYRHTGASFQKAQDELAAGVLSNPGVQQAAVSAMTNQSSRY